jgi:hypothetical protein
MDLTERLCKTTIETGVLWKRIIGATAPKLLATFTIALLMNACVWVFSPVAEAIIKLDSLVVALPFDEGAGNKAKDLSPHGNDGLLVEGAKWGDGKFGKCLRVKEPNHVEVANNESFWLHDKDFTLAITINFSQEPGTTGLIAHDNGLGAESFKAVWELLGGVFKFHINNGANNVAWAQSDFFGTPELNRWYSVVLVKKGKTYTHYLDGELFGVDEKDEPIPVGIDNPLTIGMAEHTFYFPGFIDEVVVAHTPWAQQDAQRYFAGGIQGVLAVRPGGKLAGTWGGLKSNRNY